MTQQEVLDVLIRRCKKLGTAGSIDPDNPNEAFRFLMRRFAAMPGITEEEINRRINTGNV